MDEIPTSNITIKMVEKIVHKEKQLEIKGGELLFEWTHGELIAIEDYSISSTINDNVEDITYEHALNLR